MIASGELPGGELIKINGRASVLVSQVLAFKLGKIYSAIAFFDPKQGERGLDRYVVTVSQSSKYQIGDILDINRRENSKNIKLAICGFANTGKTCFREGLKKGLLQIPKVPEFYIVSGCPDGDGSWFSETAKRDVDLAKKLKSEYKAKFNEEFAKFKAREFQNVKDRSWLNENFPQKADGEAKLSDALIEQLIIYSTGGNILAFCPAAFVDDLANAIEKRYTHETLTANSCALGDCFNLFEIKFGLLRDNIEETFWLDKYKEKYQHPIIEAYFGKIEIDSDNLEEKIIENFKRCQLKLPLNTNSPKGIRKP